MKNLNLKQLRVFLTVAEMGSFTGAAMKLFLSQSTVSSHIQALEEDLCVVLFLREAKKQIRLTKEGNRLIPYAREIISRCDALEHSLSGYVEKELVIGASTVPAQSFVPRYVSEFLKKHPGTSVSIHTGDSEEILNLLMNHEIQLGFVGTHYNRQSLTYEAVGEDHLVLVTPNLPEFFQMKERGVYGRELLDQPLILRETGSGTQAMVDFYLNRLEGRKKPLAPVVRTSDPGCIKELVRLGTGVALMSARTVQDAVKTGQVIQFELEEIPVVRRFYMIHRKKGGLSELGQSFLELVRAEPFQSYS
ncbi:selenium metabolism-associated LysR family transcriptional regulator [Clostridiaceae bacterium HFYG-1003]|nr:selenium metabolism-associated LysR family transcriptional regulator [Clostridiaceae bacterium HFYG-1003]